VTRPVEERLAGRVAWAETDPANVFYYARPLHWVDEAETALWRRLGDLERLATMPRRRIEVDYLRPLGFDDEYETRLWLDSAGRTSLVWQFEVVSAGEVCVRGKMVSVHVDADGSPLPLPLETLDALGADGER
jgi:YbgC/YbaW family acyl-CoA thioester hydrolase